MRGLLPRGDPHNKKGRGCFLEILKRTPKRYQEPTLWVWLEFFLRYILANFFQLNTLKGTAKTPAVDLLTLNTLRGYKTAFFNYFDDHPSPFYIPTPPTKWGISVLSRGPIIFELFFCKKYLLVGASSMLWTGQWMSKSVSQ